MTPWFLLVSLAYVVLIGGIYRLEARRTRVNGIDAISIFLFLFVLQCCFSAAGIYGVLPFVDSLHLTGVYAFDRILSGTDLTAALLILGLTAAFVLFFYAGCSLGRYTLSRLCPPQSTEVVHSLTVSKWRLTAVLMLGLALTLYSFMQLDDTMIGRYANLVLLRAQDPQIERTALNANAFALTQSWSWLSIVAIFCIGESRKWRGLLLIFVLAAVAFALLGVSRRALFIPLLMTYLTFVLYSDSWKLRWVATAAVPLVVWVAFGKDLLAALAYQGTIESVAGSYASWASAFLRAASDIGITVIESLGTIQFLQLEPRLGFDHLIAMVRIVPEQSLGFDFDYPERIVRISTAAFDGPNELDVPPGLLGQMWLDFRLAGPAVWGILFGLQMSIVQFFFERTRCTRQSSAIFVLVAFIVALPLNSGSFDFTFSVDIIAIAVVLLACVRSSPQQLLTAERIGSVPTHS
jgi:hypothetical protein